MREPGFEILKWVVKMSQHVHVHVHVHVFQTQVLEVVARRLTSERSFVRSLSVTW